jgi:Ni/Fe-hydrogenase 1 B-type cytochrome subunit
MEARDERQARGKKTAAEPTIAARVKAVVMAEATAGSLDVSPNQRRVYVWDMVVRITHWSIAFSIVVLTVTGIYIGNPFDLRTSVPTMGAMKMIHYYGAIVFTLAVLARLLWMFVGSKHARWQNFIPVSASRRKQFLQTLSFYLFVRWRPPPVAGHNAVAGASYVAIFALYLVMIVSGLGIYAISADVNSPLRWFEFMVAPFGGAQGARWVHHVVMWLLLGFTVHHVYSATLMSVVEKNGTIDSIISGYKWLDHDEEKEEK